MRVDTGACLSSGRTNMFGYNAKSEVTSALMGGNSFGYDYDPIGNRTTSTNNGVGTSYAANMLNEYTNIVGGVNQVQLFDADGNLTNNGVYTFKWDGENRLISVSNSTSVLLMTYDYMSRRVSKSEATKTGARWAAAQVTQFRYDGWNMVMETYKTRANSYIWGQDLSGTMQGAGGIGGLLAFVKTTGSDFPNDRVFLYACDGNGNVTDLLNSSGGNVAAHYEYDPYGNTIASSGAQSANNPFRFSTKYCDSETGLYYYGYRYLDTVSGRWTGRDPIQEFGGRNLLGFCANNPVMFRDGKGLSIVQDAIGMKLEGACRSGSEVLGAINCAGWDTSTYTSVAKIRDVMGAAGGTLVQIVKDTFSLIPGVGTAITASDIIQALAEGRDSEAAITIAAELIKAKLRQRNPSDTFEQSREAAIDLAARAAIAKLDQDPIVETFYTSDQDSSAGATTYTVCKLDMSYNFVKKTGSYNLSCNYLRFQGTQRTPSSWIPDWITGGTSIFGFGGGFGPRIGNCACGVRTWSNGSFDFKIGDDGINWASATDPNIYSTQMR